MPITSFPCRRTSPVCRPSRNPGGLLGYATAWLEYRLRGAFAGAHPELVSDANWPGSAVK
jgi:hypothetical protein